eukprot:CAMPEP_0194277790 /NCGR_PEP_ID=MMETSP0169-20130528/10014_1 /TAXON_ID=218684 /ORGANISM="Corethron pennatum, Strain L29A3" /LENGTH=401 /DNA_ID=CAMNT_0039021835 /DNA_START=162 /DNA_END=1364 /DNA_ORIENTATION=+
MTVKRRPSVIDMHLSPKPPRRRFLFRSPIVAGRSYLRCTAGAAVLFFLTLTYHWQRRWLNDEPLDTFKDGPLGTFKDLLQRENTPRRSCNAMHKPSFRADSLAALAAADDRERAAGAAALPAHHIDFAVVAFPKCATTSVHALFHHTDETDMMPGEYCRLIEEKHTVEEELALRGEIRAAVAAMPPGKKTAFKCPHLLKHAVAISRLASMYPDAVLLVGVRHPVLFFESFYNFRVTNPWPDPYDWKKWTIHPPESLIGFANGWMDLDTDIGRYELTLMQLGKVPLTDADLSLLACKGLSLAPTQQRVFVYDLGQVQDADADRGRAFLDAMGKFVGLETPLQAMPLVDPKHKTVPPEVEAQKIDICDQKFDALRTLLLERSKVTATFVLDRFLRSPEVIVGG